MPQVHTVQVNEGYKQVVLPNGEKYTGPAVVNLTSEQYQRIRQDLFSSGMLTDLGATLDPALVEALDEWAAGGGGGGGGSDAVEANTVDTDAYTLVLEDAGKVVRMTFAGASTITIPDDVTVAFPVGTILNVYAAGGGLALAVAAGVTLRNNTAALPQYAEVSLRKDAANEWVRV